MTNAEKPYDLDEKKSYGWFYKQPNFKSNIVYIKKYSPPNQNDFDLWLLCPSNTYPKFVLAFNADGLTLFPKESILYTAGEKQTLHIPLGLAFLVQIGATEVYLIDKYNHPVLCIDWHTEIFSFMEVLERPQLDILHKPLINNFKDLISSDIDDKYPNLKIDGIHDGELVYTNTKNIATEACTLKYMTEEWSITDDIIFSETIGVSLKSIDWVLTALQTELPTEQSTLYTTIKRFAEFLLFIGYENSHPSYENLNDAYIAYSNIKSIDQILTEQNGTCDINMIPFEPLTCHHSPVISFKDWQEKSTGIKYEIY